MCQTVLAHDNGTDDSVSEDGIERGSVAVMIEIDSDGGGGKDKLLDELVIYIVVNDDDVPPRGGLQMSSSLPDPPLICVVNVC